MRTVQRTQYRGRSFVHRPRQLYRRESLYPPIRPVTVVVLRGTVEGTCSIIGTSHFVNMYGRQPATAVSAVCQYWDLIGIFDSSFLFSK